MSLGRRNFPTEIVARAIISLSLPPGKPRESPGIPLEEPQPLASSEHKYREKRLTGIGG